MEEKEIWKDIVGFEGMYQISNMGRVKSVERTAWSGLNGGCYRTVPERILKAMKNSNGYLYVQLCKDGINKNYTVHQLVGNAFLSNPQDYKELNHRDEDKTNNCVNNLEWCSRSYNLTYNGRAKKAGEKLRGRKQSEEHIKKRSKSILGIDKVTGLIVEFPSAKEAEREMGIAQSNITKCCKGKLNSCGGFYWMYKNNNDDTE